MKCKIQWVTKLGERTPDTNEAVQLARTKAHTFTRDSAGSDALGLALPQTTIPIEAGPWLPICAEHSKRLSALPNWESAPLSTRGSSFMNEPDDLDWLFDVHLKHLSGERRQYKAFILYGNEDAPEQIDLYEDAEPLITAPAWGGWLRFGAPWVGNPNPRVFTSLNGRKSPDDNPYEHSSSEDGCRDGCKACEWEVENCFNEDGKLS